MNRLLRPIAIFLHLISIGIWIPALLLPLLTIRFGAGESGFMALFSNAISQEKTLSIWTSITELVEQKHSGLAFLIFFFALVVPMTKTILLSLGLIFPNRSIGRRASRFVFFIGKWAMADVFVVGITIAFMTINSQVMVKAKAETGLYIFAAYVLLSTLAAQLSLLVPNQKPIK